MLFCCPLLNLFHRADIIHRDPLTLVYEKNRALRRRNDLLDLILSLIMKQSGFLIQSVCFIRKDRIDHSIRHIHIASGAFEHVGHTAFFLFTLQLSGINLPRCTVLRGILYQLILLRQLRKKTNCNHTFPCSRSSLADDSPLLSILLTLL